MHPLRLLVLAALLAAPAFAQPVPAAAASAPNQDPRARAILDAAKAKLLSIPALVADYEMVPGGAVKDFDRQGEIFLERPNRFRIDGITGAAVEVRALRSVSDGRTITELNGGNFAAFEKPVRAENFFLGHNFLVQFFFDPRGIAFDPTDSTWGRSVSLFDTNLSAYDRDTQLALLGSRALEGIRCDVVEIKYNTAHNDIRQQVYVGRDKLVYQVDTYLDGQLNSQRFRNFRPAASLPPDTWKKTHPDRMPVIAIDPVRLGAEAPDFTLPGATGGEVTLKNLLAGKKGLFVCVLDGEAGRKAHSADVHLGQMRVLQDMKNRFEPQGLAVVCIVGGTGITPDLKDEMLMNWMPNLTRFNYPIAIDIDLEKGIQGSAFHNFQLNGRNNLLLDAQGRVVFASKNFSEKVNQLAFYQALAQIGFAVSAAELETAIH